MQIDTRVPSIEFHGPAAAHDQACAVMWASCEPAVYEYHDGNFHPSWKAQAVGWRLVFARNRFQRFMLYVLRMTP